MKRWPILITPISITYVITVALALASVVYETEEVVYAQGSQECVSVETSTPFCGVGCGWSEIVTAWGSPNSGTRRLTTRTAPCSPADDPENCPGVPGQPWRKQLIQL